MTDAKNNSLLKWVLGSVGAGLFAIGAFAQVAFSSFMARSDQETKFLREDLRQSLGAVVRAQEIQNANQAVVVRAIDAQTAVLVQMKEDQARGVWRAIPPPEKKPDC